MHDGRVHVASSLRHASRYERAATLSVPAALPRVINDFSSFVMGAFRALSTFFGLGISSEVGFRRYKTAQATPVRKETNNDNAPKGRDAFLGARRIGSSPGPGSCCGDDATGRRMMNGRHAGICWEEVVPSQDVRNNYILPLLRSAVVGMNVRLSSPQNESFSSGGCAVNNIHIHIHNNSITINSLKKSPLCNRDRRNPCVLAVKYNRTVV